MKAQACVIRRESFNLKVWLQNISIITITLLDSSLWIIAAMKDLTQYQGVLTFLLCVSSDRHLLTVCVCQSSGYSLSSINTAG